MKDLAGRTAAVTGAASGIGRAIALELARRGCRLELADVDDAGLLEVAGVARALGAHARTARVDVADCAAVDEWAAEVQRESGGADLLVNNAGVTVYGTFRAVPAEDLRWLLGVNMAGVMNGCRAFLPQIVPRRGHVVNMSSMAAMVGMPMQATYCASKAAVRAFSIALRAELAPLGVGVSVVLPGTTATRLLAGARSPHPEVAQAMVRGMGRVGISPERVARAVARAIRRNRAEVHVGLDAHLLSLTMALAPWLPRLALGLLFGRLAGPCGEPHEPKTGARP